MAFTSPRNVTRVAEDSAFHLYRKGMVVPESLGSNPAIPTVGKFLSPPSASFSSSIKWRQNLRHVDDANIEDNV